MGAADDSPGLDYWLGEGAEITFKKRAKYDTHNGTTGEIRSYNDGSLLRLTWQPPQWDFASTLQIRVTPASKGTTISIHHEKLESSAQREEMRQRWTKVLDQLDNIIKNK